MSDKPLPKMHGYRWDEHRNTSRVFPVPPDALTNALKALAALRRSDPALVAWIESGHPNLTEDRHRALFGEDYTKASRSKTAQAGSAATLQDDAERE